VRVNPIQEERQEPIPRNRDNRTISQYNRKYTAIRSITGIDRALRTPSSRRDESRGEVYWIYLPENNY
jgi:hypothetical protein